MSGVLPQGACDCHCHVFGPAARFPYAEPRSYTPDDAPLEAYLALLDRLGFDHGVLVQPSAYGRDNRAMLDALTRAPTRLRGVAVGGAELDTPTLKLWHAAGVRGLRANEFRRDGQPYYQNGVTLKEIEPLLPSMADLGWHLQLWIDASDLTELLPALAHVNMPVVVDHMGRMDYRHGTNHPGFQALLRGVGEGRLWSKLSGTYRLGATPPDYAEARPFHDALVAANPNNLVWGTDWPHPRPEGPAPDAARLSKVFLDWTTRDHRHPILVDNPSRLYDLPITDRTRGTADGRDRSANGDDRRGQKNKDNQQRGKEDAASGSTT
jgi:predicted TIM-barrel fold metal-dependent hydrolase